MNTNCICLERPCGSANNGCENVKNISDPATMDESAVNVKAAPRSRNGVFKRFRKWAVKKLRAVFRIRSRRNRCRSPEGTVCTVKEIGKFEFVARRIIQFFSYTSISY